MTNDTNNNMHNSSIHDKSVNANDGIIFQKLRPLCIAAMECQSSKEFSALEHAISLLRKHELIPMLDYVIYPSLTYLSRSSTHGRYSIHSEAAVSMLVVALCRSGGATSITMFKGLLKQITMMFSGYDEASNKSILLRDGISEEEQEKLVECIAAVAGKDISISSQEYSNEEEHSVSDEDQVEEAETMVQNSRNTESVNRYAQAALSDVEFRPSFGHTVSVLLEIIATCKHRGIRILTMRVLSALLSIADPSVTETFLPGVASGLANVTKNSNPGQYVVITALKSWAHAVIRVMADSRHIVSLNLRDSTKGALAALQSVSTVTAGDTDNISYGSELALQDERLSTVLAPLLLSAANHANWRVRVTAVRLSLAMAKQCSRVLPICLALNLETLVGAIGDEFPDVATCGRQGIEELVKSSSEFTRARLQSALPALVERFDGLIASLPRIFRGVQTTEKLSAARRFVGYLHSLASLHHAMGLTFRAISTPLGLNKVSRALIQSLEIHANGDVRLVEDYNRGTPDPVLYRHRFRHVSDSRTLLLLRDSIRLIGRHGCLHAIIDHFLHTFLQQQQEVGLGNVLDVAPRFASEATFILTEILLGAAGMDVAVANVPLLFDSEDVQKEYIGEKHHRDLFLNSVERVHEVWLQSCFQNLRTSNSVGTSTLGVIELHSNIILICSILDAVARTASILQQPRRCLVHVLFPMLARAGDASCIVAASALHSLHELAISCGHYSVHELLVFNQDYLTDAICLRLRHDPSNNDAVRVLSAMLHILSRHKTSETINSQHSLPVVALAEDTLNEISDLLDTFSVEVYVVECLLGLLRDLIIALRVECLEEEDTNSLKSLSAMNDEVVDCFDHKGFISRVLVAAIPIANSETLLEDNETKIDDKDSHENGNSEEIATSSRKREDIIASRVLEKTLHFLACDEVNIRMLTLRCIYEGSPLIEKAHLMPLAHQLWPSLLSRLKDRSPVVSATAIDALLVLARGTGDFLKGRVLKEACPVLLEMLRVTSKNSKAIANDRSPGFKLQMRLLEAMAEISALYELLPAEVDNMVHSCLPYLAAHYPVKLQEASQTVIMVLVGRDQFYRDIIWLAFIPYVPSKSIVLQHRCIDQCTLPPIPMGHEQLLLVEGLTVRAETILSAIELQEN